MKKVVVVLFILVGSISSFAQFDKGRMLAGGVVGIDFKKSMSKDNGNTRELYRTTSTTFEPNFAYFIADRFALGAAISLTHSRTRTPNDRVDTSEQLTFAPLLRYYLPSKFFFQMKIPMGRSTNTFESNGDISRNSYGVLGLGLGAGYAIFLNSHVALEPMIQFTSTRYNGPDSSMDLVQNDLNLRMGLQVYLGK